MARLMVRPGLLDRLKEIGGIATDEAMADIAHVSLSTYYRYRNREKAVTSEFVARIGKAFGLGPGEVAVIEADADTEEKAA
ncbi:hypothetical protein [Actinomyces urogenitalis]|nr:hypothetical protein [Actinomyces urogenitalis]MDU0864457.1 hypothetical protein [Actinomyces urogenitalis]MDU0875003.1 hypothetical protein [Actinomyces urogenitalis]MDU1565326.1 hypothetical protein [Actinomyces urogenitalis]MDU1640569.1 hypothetical protein [Actinomyces urogenitalis]MDU6777743.1 hypothetical protein [Actinomyces urogenitalis]